MIPSIKTVGRLAPSPTGFLHLGNAWAFLLAFLACRLENGKLFLRMEDIDPARSKKNYAQSIIDDLTWLGIDWDDEIIWQSERYTLYEKVLDQLAKLTYPCYCTRKELRDLAGAPQKERYFENLTNKKLMEQTKSRFVMPDAGAPYLGICRNLSSEKRIELKAQKKSCIRIACPPFILPTEELFLTEYLRLTANYPKNNSKPKENFDPTKDQYKFIDSIHGEQNISLLECGGDFALKRSDGVFAYQLAVCCDDKELGINQIVRGDDILTSTPRQLYLHSLLGSSITTFAHIPLLLDKNGDRLAKRHQSQALAYLREQGTSPKQIISRLATLMGFEGEFQNAQDLLEKLQSTGLNKFPWQILSARQSFII